MTHLAIQEITNIILDYATETSYNYAVLLNGQWGSGKTWYVHHELIPALEQTAKKKAIYFSFFGKSTVEELEKGLFSVILGARMSKMLEPQLTEAARGNRQSAGTRAEFPAADYRDYVFLFDDLERCSIPVNEMLGYVNHFLEQNSARVVLVANEEEMGSLEREKALEAKYFLAIQDSIEWPKLERSSIYEIIHQRKHEVPLDREEIKRRKNYLFEESAFYKQIKEKLIGRTIYFAPALSEIIPVLYRQIVDPEEPADSPMIHEITGVLERESYNNLRTLQSSLLFYKKLLADAEAVSTEIDSDVFDACMRTVMASILYTQIYWIRDNKSVEWEKYKDCGVVSLKEREGIFAREFFSFRFVDEYVMNAEYRSGRIQKILRHFFTQKQEEKERANNPLTRLRYYWQLEDKEAKALIEEMYGLLKAKQYSKNQFPEILSILFVLKGIGFEPRKVSEFYELIEQQISEDESTSLTYFQLGLNEGEPYYEELVQYFEKLRAIEQKKRKLRNGNDIDSVFKEERWGRKLYEYYQKNQGTILDEKAFFALADVDLCMKCISMASGQDLVDFRGSLREIYKFSHVREFLAADGEKLRELRTRLEGLEDPGVIKGHSVKLLMSDLDVILKRLGVDAETGTEEEENG